MKKMLLLGAMLMSCSAFFAQSTLSGILLKEGSNEPIVGAIVTLRQQEISVVTNENGEFTFNSVEAGNDVLEFEQEEIGLKNKPVNIKIGDNQLGEVAILADGEQMMANEVMLSALDTDFAFDDEDGMSQQTVSGMLYSRGDVFLRTASYTFSPARYRVRGYGQSDEHTYVNGVNFNDLERGRFNYSSLGGLNDASRNKENVMTFAPNNYTFGGLGNTTSIDMRPSKFAAGTKVTLSGTNRSYWLRAAATYATGIMPNGWSFAASLAYRWSLEGIQEGTFYNSGGYYLGAEKIFNEHHSLSLVTYGSPTERSGSSALTQETVDLTSIYYNPYWGWQDGKKRNSRIVKSFDPTIILSHIWKIDENQNLTTGLATHHSKYSNSALTFYNAPDPRPDYYRNLPSYQLGGWKAHPSNGVFYHDFDYRMSGGSENFEGGDKSKIVSNAEVYNTLNNMWRAGYKAGGNATTQIDWNSIYQANYANNTTNPNGIAKYMLERRHNDLAEVALNSVYDHKFLDEKLKLVVGLEGKYSIAKHYKTVDDLLGGNQWIDIDPFADRDIADLSENADMNQSEIAFVRQNDVDNPNKVVKTGDVFGYNYNINVARASVFAHNEWDFNKLKFYYGLKFTYTGFNRFGYMKNGRAELQEIQSKGTGKTHNFIDPAGKLGISYDFNGHHHIEANAMAETRSPLPNNFYMQQRVSDLSAKDYYHDNNIFFNYLQEKVVSYDFSYILRYPIVNMRVTGYRTHFWGGIEQNGYYNDEYRTFINSMMVGVNKIHQGVEFAASVKLNSSFTLTGTLAYNEAHYTNNPYVFEMAENGMKINKDSRVLYDRVILNPSNLEIPNYNAIRNACMEAKMSDSEIQNRLQEEHDAYINTSKQLENNQIVKVASGPQLVANLKLNYFHQKMWFAEVSLSYFDENYLGIAPSRFMQGIMTGKRYDVVHQTYIGETTSSYTDEQRKVLGTQESLVSPNWYERIMLDLSVGKLIYLKNRRSININLSVSNATNNKGMKTGGYQTGRIPTTTYRGDAAMSNNVYKYPAKYYYAWGVNFFLNVGFKF